MSLLGRIKIIRLSFASRPQVQRLASDGPGGLHLNRRMTASPHAPAQPTSPFWARRASRSGLLRCRRRARSQGDPCKSCPVAELRPYQSRGCLQTCRQLVQGEVVTVGTVSRPGLLCHAIPIVSRCTTTPLVYPCWPTTTNVAGTT